jgi:hypothetical protein
MMEIETIILKKATHCESDFECLAENSNCTCLDLKPTRCVDRKILFVKCTDYLCKYHMVFGHATVCNSPLRVEMFNKYKR